jgi:hypothetical protein
VIRAFLSFLESHGAGEVAAGALRAALAEDGPEGRAALVAEGVLQAGSPATTYACEGLDCAREVRERPRAPGGPRRFFAVCTRSPRECETLDVAEAELAQDVIALEEFVAVVRRALRIEAPLAPPRATGDGLVGSDEPRLLGEQLVDGVARDVFFVRRPSPLAMRALLAERRATPRGALVLVPTARGIDPEVLTRHATAHVEVAALTDLLVVQRGRIAAAARLRVVAVAAAAPAGGEARLPRAKRWNEMTFYSVEDEGKIGIEIDRRSWVVTAAELGLTTRNSGKPVRAFALLRRICDGNGAFDTRPWGERENGKQVVSELRRALSAAFEISESAIEGYSRVTKSWKPRFRALAGAPAEVRRVEREMRGE